MTDYNAQILDEYDVVNGTVERVFADIVQIKTASGDQPRYRAEKVINRLRPGQSLCIIARKGSDEAAVVLNRSTRKTLRLESMAANTAMAKYVAGLSLYALGAVVFFSGLLDPSLSTKLGLGLFAAGLAVIIFTPIRDDNAYADAFNAFLDAQWKNAPAGIGAAFTSGSAFR